MKKSLFCLVLALLSQISSFSQEYVIDSIHPEIIFPGKSFDLELILNKDRNDFDTITSVKFSIGNSDSLIFDFPFSEFNWARISGVVPETASGKTAIVLLYTVNGIPNKSISRDNILTIGTDIETSVPEICAISVNESFNNVIAWENPDLNSLDSIFIYKETNQSNKYEKIASNSVDELSVFIDTNSNAAQQSNRYKISFLDNTGYETQSSVFHKTMHLTINEGLGNTYNLIWDKYEGISFSTYDIYRGNSPETMMKIAEIANNLFTFSDINPPVGDLIYQVRVVNPNGCNVSNLKSTDYSIIGSNVVVIESSSGVNSIKNNILYIYPNPANDYLSIQTEESNKQITFSILTYSGKSIVQNMVYSKGEIDISTLPNGIYILQILIDNQIINRKLIIGR